jgi:ankyrin repeat protein
MTRQQKIIAATKTGDYPEGTTAGELAKIITDAEHGTTALHTAAKYGHLPIGTTAEQLDNTKNNYGTTALLTAAIYGHLPAETTVPPQKPA